MYRTTYSLFELFELFEKRGVVGFFYNLTICPYASLESRQPRFQPKRIWKRRTTLAGDRWGWGACMCGVCGVCAVCMCAREI